MIVPEVIAAIPIFVASLVGSPHCVGMCGGFVAIYSHTSNNRLLPHMLYNFGRLITYLTLGLLAALLGRSLDIFSGVNDLSSFIVGIFLIAMGLFQLLRRQVVFFDSSQQKLATLVRNFASPLLRTDTPLKPMLIGAVTTLLPCGWLYTFIALALGSADIKAAFLIMFFFWLGTLPVMISLGLASRLVTQRLGTYLPRLTALILILSGLLSLTLHLAHKDHHTSHSGHHGHHH